MPLQAYPLLSRPCLPVSLLLRHQPAKNTRVFVDVCRRSARLDCIASWRVAALLRLILGCQQFFQLVQVVLLQCYERWWPSNHLDVMVRSNPRRNSTSKDMHGLWH